MEKASITSLFFSNILIAACLVAIYKVGRRWMTKKKLEMMRVDVLPSQLTLPREQRCSLEIPNLV